MCTNVCVVTTNEKTVPEFERAQGGNMEEFGGRKGKEK